MNLSFDNQNLPSRSVIGVGRGGVGLVRVFYSAALCLALGAAHATAGVNNDSTTSTSDRGGAKPAPNKKVIPKSGGCAESGQTPDPVVAKEPSGPASGSPRWSCAAETLVIDPIWAGDQIDCSFMIRNTGDRNLEIKAKGG